MVEVSIGLNRISEKEGVKEMNYPDLVDDRAEPKISIPIPIHSFEYEIHLCCINLSFSKI